MSFTEALHLLELWGMSFIPRWCAGDATRRMINAREMRGLDRSLFMSRWNGHLGIQNL